MNRSLDPWFETHLICPQSKEALRFTDGFLVSKSGTRRYPVIDGIPVLLLSDAEQTLRVAEASLGRASGRLIDARAPDLYLESLGISEPEKQALLAGLGRSDGLIDPVVSALIGATNGRMYRELAGKLREYPIPELRLPDGNGRSFLDIGCNWGRWSIAAARKGYDVTGIDPSLGAAMAARRAAKQLGVHSRVMVADARFLPFPDESFDVVFSYSVLQHFSRKDARDSIRQAGRILKSGGTCFVQMPNKFGIGCLVHQARRRFREGKNFEVRYWTLADLKASFSGGIGPCSISVDCFFGLGLQKADLRFMSAPKRILIHLSEMLRKLSIRIRWLVYASDSVYINAKKPK